MSNDLSRPQHLHDGDRPSSQPFDYDAVESDADLLAEKLSEVKLTPVQAAAVLTWHRNELISQERHDRASIIGRVIGELLDSRNVRMDVHGLAFAAGLDQAFTLGSEADAARRLKVTRAAVCKNVGKWRNTLGYSVTKFTRSDRNRENCREAQLNDHWRYRTS